jgi:hypothetical protein
MAASLGEGVALMVCGVVFTAWGGAVATDFRGLVTKVIRALGPVRPWSMDNPWRFRGGFVSGSVGYYRAIGWIFVSAGPVMFIVGTVNVILSQGQGYEATRPR